jgi:hypothetical protein
LVAYARGSEFEDARRNDTEQHFAHSPHAVFNMGKQISCGDVCAAKFRDRVMQLIDLLQHSPEKTHFADRATRAPFYGSPDFKFTES